MRLDSMVCRVEQAEELEQLGLNQKNSVFYWREAVEYEDGTLGYELAQDGERREHRDFAALTSEELAELIKPLINGDLGESVRFEHLCWYRNESWARAAFLIRLMQRERDRRNRVNPLPPSLDKYPQPDFTS